MPNGDVLTPEQRSKCMSHIRGKDTKAELQLRKALWNEGLRYRIHYKILPGKPDIVFISSRLAIFVDGCFWHGCPIHFKFPNTNKEFWNRKINGNITRDQNINEQLKNMGWNVMRVWEHEIEKEIDSIVVRIKKLVKPEFQFNVEI